MNYRVEIPPYVENQILDQALYIARDSVEQALLWADGIQSKIKGLGEMPHASSVDTDASVRAGHEVRRRAIGNYLVFYFVDEENGVVVMEGFRHGARQPGTD
ncbi:MAG: type II toxin-antitoxin system RelE/ParE family toxin [Planctomycetota bacterium]